MKIVYLDESAVGMTPLDEIKALGEYVGYANSTREEALQRVADCDVLIINKIIADAELMDAAPKLKLICESATGVNNIDLKEAERRGIVVRNVAGYSTESVAQTAFAHLLNLANNISRLDEYVKSGKYSGCGMFAYVGMPGTELCGKTMGIIGLGAIGRRVAQIASAFGMKVVYYSTSGTAHCSDYPCVTLEELLRGSDVVSVHAPLNERTMGLIGDKELAMMKPTAILLNLGRGAIADEHAVARAIDAGVIAGAGLDVYEPEPLPADSPLLRLREPWRVSLSPHSAWGTRESLRRLVSEVAANIRKGW